MIMLLNIIDISNQANAKSPIQETKNEETNGIMICNSSKEMYEPGQGVGFCPMVQSFLELSKYGSKKAQHSFTRTKNGPRARPIASLRRQCPRAFTEQLSGGESRSHLPFKFWRLSS